MRHTLMIVTVLAAAGAGASVLLVPREQELALIQLKGQRFDEAQAAYDRALAEGNLTPEVVNAVVDLSLQRGDVEQAVAIMERYVAQSPADLAARKRLGELYQYAQRPDDYLKNLEEMNRLSPSPEFLAQLSQLYNANHSYEQQAEALKQLIAIHKDAPPQYYVDLANILAVQQSRGEAIEALSQLKTRYPEMFGFKEQELLVSLLLDEKRGDEAYQSAEAWRQAGRPPAEVARLINLLHYKGSIADAEKLLNTYDTATIEADPALMEEKILIQLDSGQEGEVYARLQALHAEGKLSPQLSNRLLFLAISRGDLAVADPMLAGLDLRTLDEAQALSLLELSMMRGDEKLEARVRQAFSEPEYQSQHPVLAAMLAYTAREKNAAERLNQLAEANLSPQQNLQVARICIRMKDYTCGERFLNRLPDAESLTDAEVAGVGALYYDLGQMSKGYDFMKRMNDSRPSPLIREVYVKFAAARGDDEAVNAWLAENGKTASPRTLTDLFFAARNHKHHKLARTVAEQLHAQEQSARTRSYLASAYVSTGEYAKAVALLRDNRELSDADESNYLLALTKLARGNAEYRRELGSYAASRLNSGLPYQRKLSLIHALIDAGQADVAMPHIRTLAMKNGGEWAWLYASQLTKQGKHEEARAFWVKLASQPGISDRQRRQIGFNLLSGGYTADAEPIFRRLAENRPASSPEVQQLVYLWGPRLEGEQLDWLAARYGRAASASERAEWATLIANHAAPDALVSFAEERHPETLYSPPVMKAYISALARLGQLPQKHEALLRGVEEQGDPALLAAYAEAARAHGYPREAREAYTALFAKTPDDNNVLRELGMLSHGASDYGAARSYLDEYVAAGGLTEASPEEGHAAAFVYADLLARDKQYESADQYYRYTVGLVDAAGLSDSAALGRRAQSLVNLGETEAGLTAFSEAEAHYPNDAGVQADHVGTLIDLGRFDEARTLLSNPLSQEVLNATPSAGGDAIPLPVPEGTVARDAAYAGGSELLLHFNASDDDVHQFASNAESLSWISYVSEGYRQALVVAKPGYSARLERDASGRLAVVPVPLNSGPTSVANAMRLRYELLTARLDMEEGNIYAATTRLNRLLPEYPNNPQLMGFVANAENYGGNWQRAQVLLTNARILAPENEDIARLDRSIRRGNAPGIKLDHEWVHRKRSDEQITTLSGYAHATENVVVGFVAQNNDVDAKNLRRDDGRIGKFDAKKQRGELYATYHDENGVKLKGSLFANNDTLGAGAYFQFLNPLGTSGINAEFHRSYWEYVEGIFDDATRDRISLWHTFRPMTRLSVHLEPGFNRYNTDRFSNVASAWSMDAHVVYRPYEDDPYLYLAYGLSAEYLTNKKYRFDATGGAYRPLSVRTREIHFVSINTGYDFSDETYAGVLLGYGVDRFGGHGPMIEGRITHEFDEMFDAQLRASYGLDSQDSDNNITRVGGYLRLQF